ncbi:MAG: maleylpyruvate isomerase family mycothiol-dependent enzyme [Acidimicrobiia bacterium]
MTMDPVGWTGVVRANAGMLTAAARRAGVDAAVVTCPKWTVADLCAHVGNVHRWVTAIVGDQSQQNPGFPSPSDPPEDPVAWVEEGVDQLLAVLESADPDGRVWNWASPDPEPARFWYRRMAHETVIHRVDAESAVPVAGRVEPAELAADGLDELFGMLPARVARQKRMAELVGSYHFHTTDTEGEWVVDFADGAVTVAREHAKRPVAVRGPASALELFVYHRGPADEVEVLGDDSLMGAWHDHVRF